MKPKNWVQRANVAIEGIIYVVKTQRHMRYHLFAAVAALILGLVLNISRSDILLLCMAIVLVLATEMLNTAIETMVDMISEEFHPMARNAKDIAAGVVLIASIGALMLGYLILYPALKAAVTAENWQIRKTPNDVVAFVALAVVIILVIILKAFLGKGEPLRGGMPSGHAAIAFSIWTIICFLANNAIVVILTFLMAFLIARHRIKDAVHTLWEVVAGGALGVLLTALVFQLFR